MPENLTRREFLKDLGLTAAGIGVAGAMVGVSAEKAHAAADAKPSQTARKFWWVKSQDEPTIEIDWQQMQRYKEWMTTRGSLKKYRDSLFGPGFHEKLLANQKADMKKWELEGRSGYQTIDAAMRAAGGATRAAFQFMGPQRASTPEDRGVPRYEGTPEENSNILNVALRHLGAGTVGFLELDPATTMKLIYDEQPNRDNRKIRFEDIDVGYVTDDKIALPNKARYAVVFTSQMSGETMQRCPTMTGTNTTGLTYTRLWNTLAQAHEFIRALGWHSYGTTSFNGLGIYPAMAVMAGLGEMSRLNRVISPEYGPMMRETFFLTDLPVAPTKPINFGVMDFCRRCKRCSELCPPKALSFEKEPSWEVRGEWNNPGHRAYFEDSVKCRNYWNATGRNCGICFAVCPYTQDDESTIQAIWKATASVTPVFDGAVKRVTDRAFPSGGLGSPIKSPESWWNNENLPEYGIDTMAGGKKL